jgi:hypothetical protein
MNIRLIGSHFFDSYADKAAPVKHLLFPRSIAGIVISLCCSLLGAIQVHAQNVVVPSGATATEGNSNNAFPFDIGDGASMRYQQVYGASDFSAVPMGGGFITQIAFRPDADGGAAFSSTLPSIRIDLSTTTAAVDGLGTTFADNVGANDTIVYGGASGAPLSLSSAFTGPAGGPKDFEILVNLTTPFFYNPAAGNLLLDVRNFGGGMTTAFDAVDTLGDSVSRASTNVSDVNSSSADFTDSLGLVTRFTFQAVPEPSIWTLLLLGLTITFALKPLLRSRI